MFGNGLGWCNHLDPCGSKNHVTTRCPQADAVEKRGNAAAAAQMDWHVIDDSGHAEPVPVCSNCYWQGRRSSCSGHGERETVGNTQ